MYLWMLYMYASHIHVHMISQLIIVYSNEHWYIKLKLCRFLWSFKAKHWTVGFTSIYPQQLNTFRSKITGLDFMRFDRTCSRMISLFLSDTKISSTYVLLHFGKYKRHLKKGLSWSWLYGSWIYNYICNQCISPLMLWVQMSIRVRCTTLCDKFCQWLATGRCFSPGSWIYN